MPRSDRYIYWIKGVLGKLTEKGYLKGKLIAWKFF